MTIVPNADLGVSFLGGGFHFFVVSGDDMT